jgi:hypothetical protein
LGFLLGPFGLLFALLSSPKIKEDAPAITPPLPQFDPFEETKKCPACAETIKLTATKCRYCGERFDADQVARDLAAHETELASHVGQIRCPYCNQWDVIPRAMLPGGGFGPWCPHCKKQI